MSFIQELNHLQIPLDDIKLATNNFSDSNFIGRGGFGRVYKGQLPVAAASATRSNTIVAVKRLDFRGGQGQREFLVEIVMLSSYKHDNLVSLVGFCEESDEKIIVYKHERCGRGARVLHRDIKSSNVLLDENWQAKISDFGLSKIGPTNQDFTFLVTNAAGTYGYVDPQYVSTGVLTKESDVYSFGVILFEVLCGRLVNDGKYDDERRFLSNLARMRYEQGMIGEIIFPNIREQIKPNSLQTFSKIAYQCLNNDRKQRPTMEIIIEQLQISLEFQIGQQRFSPPERDHRERKGQMNQSLDSANRQSQNEDHVNDSIRVNNDRFKDAADDNNFQPPPTYDRGNSYIEDDGPDIAGFQIIGDAKPGGKLLSCGYTMRGTSLCMFQWVRYLQDSTREYIEGATKPEYVVTVDDVDTRIAIEVIPMDSHGRQGEIVRIFANNRKKITCDPEMQQELDKYMVAGYASFSLLLLMDSFENSEQATFTLRRSSYEAKINGTQEIIIQGKYTNDVWIKIPSGLTTQFVLTYSDGSSHRFNAFHDVRMRDTFVLTMRMFQMKAPDERRKEKA